MLKLLNNACRAYLQGEYSVIDLQSIISTTASTITSYEDREFRKYLEAVEARVDQIRFTNSDRDAKQLTGLIAEEILQVLAELDETAWKRAS